MLLVTGLSGCSDPAPQGGQADAEDSAGTVAGTGAGTGAGTVAGTAAGTAAVTKGETAGDDQTLVIFLGDSLTAGYGLDEDQSFPSLIAARLAAEGGAVRVVNAGISGDTTAGGLARLDWLLGQRPDILVVALGANDGLRGVDLADSEENLRQILGRARETGTTVLLAGMLIPPNYGPDYSHRFAELYHRLAEEDGIPLIPFLLEGVAADPGLNLADGIHPNAEGQKIVAETVWQHLWPLLEAVEQPSD